MKKFDTNIETQVLKKTNALQKNKIEELQKELESKKAKTVKSLEAIKLTDIKLRDNIRNDYQFEEIEKLADSIKEKGQLQPVLITKDNYLIAGYRRHQALSLLKEKLIITYKLDKSLKDLSEEEIKEIQFTENNQRRSLDNFQLSELFNWYLQNNFEQIYICEKYKMRKSEVSQIITINKMDKLLKAYIKEFQIYYVSQDKFEESSENEQKQYLSKGKIIGIRALFNIAKFENKDEQYKSFLQMFSNRLSKKDLKISLFKKFLDKENNSLSKQTVQATNKIERELKVFSELPNFAEIQEKFTELKLLIEQNNL
jgi:ParB/RepB/Spo0J family partition protein